MNQITEALRAARACIQQDRTILADTGMRHDNTMDPDAAAGVAEYDSVLQQIDAALAGMTHHITDEQIDALLYTLNDIAASYNSDEYGLPLGCSDVKEQPHDKMRAAVRAALAAPAPAVPSGWKLVPVEPTPDMKSAGIKVEVYSEVSDSIGALTWVEVRAIYRAMLTAAPTPPAQSDDDGDVTGQPGPLPEHGWDEVPAGAFKKPSPTHGMSLGQRIKHVGGRENAQGYIEFGSVAAVRALIVQWLRDMPPAVPKDVARDAERYRWLRDNHESCWAICEWQDDLDGLGYYRDARAPEVVDAAIDAARAAEKGGE